VALEPSFVKDRNGSHAAVIQATLVPPCFAGYVAPRARIPAKVGAHFRSQANFSARSSFFNDAFALSASDLLAKWLDID